jgi:hypothetical protein
MGDSELTSETVEEQRIEERLAMLRVSRFELIADNIHPDRCERVRRTRRLARSIGRAMQSWPPPPGVTALLATRRPPASITAKQLAKQIRRIAFELGELLFDSAELKPMIAWKRIWRRLHLHGARLQALGQTPVSDQAALCKDWEQELSEDLRADNKLFDAHMRREQSKWMLNAMARVHAAGQGEKLPPRYRTKIPRVRNGRLVREDLINTD